MQTKPFIYPFATRGGHYVYDVNKNRILTISNETFEYLDGKTEEQNIIAEKEMNTMLEKGFLSHARIKHILHPSSLNLNYLLDSALEKITLQVTQQCNLRCAYCVYAGDAGNYKNRSHQNKKMSLEMAKKAIDFLISHSQDTERINVGFYGGEPLLEFQLIKDCVSYTKKQAQGKEISFSITSNATLLSEDIVAFLNENDIMLTISLDGPREIHNKNRKFAGNGVGTFDKIMENLESMKEKYPEYLKKIMFNTVMDPEEDLKCISEFFVTYDTVKEVTHMASLPSENYAENSIKIDKSFSEAYNYELFKIFLHKLGRLDETQICRVNQLYFEQLKNTLHKKRTPTSGLYEYGHPGGPCIPGQVRLFINADGNFYPCERVSELSDAMKIGSIEEGFDIDKCQALLNIGKLTENNCKNCWAFRYCNQCAAHADDTNSLTAKKRLAQCQNTIMNIEEYFKNYCSLMELGYDFEEDDYRMLQVKKLEV